MASPPSVPTLRSHHLLLLERLRWLCHRVKYRQALRAVGSSDCRHSPPSCHLYLNSSGLKHNGGNHILKPSLSPAAEVQGPVQASTQQMLGLGEMNAVLAQHPKPPALCPPQPFQKNLGQEGLLEVT